MRGLFLLNINLIISLIPTNIKIGIIPSINILANIKIPIIPKTDNIITSIVVNNLLKKFFILLPFSFYMVYFKWRY